jgi:hypothetical protein
MSENEDMMTIMRELKTLGYFGGALQTVIAFLFWLSTEHKEIFTEYLEARRKH